MRGAERAARLPLALADADEDTRLSSTPQRWLLPPLVVTGLAVLGSLAVHLPAYVGLGVLSEILLTDQPAPPPIQLELVDSSPSHASELEVDPESVPEPAPEEPEPESESQSAPEREAEPVIARVRQPELEPEPEPTPEPPRPVQPRTVSQDRATSVSHRSRDPNVEPPEDARHLAEENSRVEEETVARVTNAQIDEPEPTPGASEEQAQEAETEGNAEEGRIADLEDVEGSDERLPTPEETRLPPPRRPSPAPSRSPTPQVAEAAEGGDGRERASSGRTPPREAAGGGRQQRGGGARQTREILVSDGTGTFRMRVPNEEPEGEGEGEEGGPAVEGRGSGEEGDGRASGRAGRGRRVARGGGRSGRGAPDLRISWSDFVSVYGEEELRRQREAWVEQRRSRTRGRSHEERWERFRAAIINYDVQVRPGNQTALNTRADPFAAYIASMHRRIHRRFAEDFLPNMPAAIRAAVASNPNLHTKLEIGIGPDGNIARIGVVATSGEILFDFGAYSAVMGAQPFEPTPEAIRSPDGLVYVHWGFYANHRQCGTFNAEAYILARGAEGSAPPPLMPGDSLFNPSPNEPRGETSVDRERADD